MKCKVCGGTEFLVDGRLCDYQCVKCKTIVFNEDIEE